MMTHLIWIGWTNKIASNDNSPFFQIWRLTIFAAQFLFIFFFSFFAHCVFISSNNQPYTCHTYIYTCMSVWLVAKYVENRSIVRQQQLCDRKRNETKNRKETHIFSVAAFLKVYSCTNTQLQVEIFFFADVVNSSVSIATPTSIQYVILKRFLSKW